MTCSCLDLPDLSLTHHITSQTQTQTQLTFIHHSPSTVEQHYYDHHRPSRLLSGRNLENSNWATLCRVPCLHLSSVSTYLSLGHHSLHRCSDGRRKKERVEETCRVGQGCHPDVASPAPDSRMEMQRWGGAKTHDLFPAALGHRDWGPRTTPPPKWKERRKKRNSQSEERQGRSRNQWWGPTLSLPISPVVCIEHPCRFKQGSWSTSGLPVPLLICPTSLSGSGGDGGSFR